MSFLDLWVEAGTDVFIWVSDFFAVFCDRGSEISIGSLCLYEQGVEGPVPIAQGLLVFG